MTGPPAVGDSGDEELATGLDRPRIGRRTVGVAVLVVLAAVTAIVLVTRPDAGGRRATPTTAAASSSLSLSLSLSLSSASLAPSPRPAAPTGVDDDYLYAAAAQDLAAAQAGPQCRAGCTARRLAGPALAQLGTGFPGLAPVAGGAVTARRGRVIMQTLEARSGTDAVIRLLVERVRAADTALRTTDSTDPRSRSVVLAVIRRGWRFTATLSVRTGVPPVAAATTWALTAPLPG